MDLQTPIEKVPLIGPAYVKRLEKLEIRTVNDLIYHIPFRFEDTTNIVKIDNITSQDPARIWTIQGRVTEIENIYTRYGKKLTKAVIEDETGIADIIWFNQPYIIKSIPQTTDILLSGKVSFDDFIRPKFVSPSYEAIKTEGSLHLGKLTPVYPETKGVSSKWLRARINDCLKKIHLEEWLPEELKKDYHLCDIKDAIISIHFPKDKESYDTAHQRIAFDEMLLIQMLMQEKRNIAKKDTADKINTTEEILNSYLTSLPFILTPSQDECIKEIYHDIANGIPMNRLLEGEVGSGKTVVAGAAMYAAAKSGYKSAIMAPTSILAKQHYDTFLNLFLSLGFNEEDVSLVTNKSKPNIEAKIFIGTQALLFQDDIIKEIALSVVDEQHRFGVHQREKMMNKNGKIIHSLTMTATPIPRTLALSIYGDLDISYIKELPKGRKPITSRIVPKGKREDLYGFVKEHLKDGRQAFIVCPLVSLSDKLNVKSAEEEFTSLSENYFKDYRLVLLHGQMKQGEKDQILSDFKDKKYDILVSTPVVEVGIDIPNANIMLIEGAERFGLAQLHQLRGRVGRGEHESFCFLMTSEETHEDKERLKVFVQNSSGLTLAEFDLQNRGPGEVYGVKQSGVPTLKAASLLDAELIKTTRQAADTIFAEGIDKYPQIKQKLINFKDEIAKLN